MRYEEEDMQMMYMRCFNDCWPQYCRLLHHSANEGHGNVREGARLKRMGVQAGFPDLLLMVARNGYHGLALELKTKKGTQSNTQKEMQMLLEEQGYRYALVRSLNDFMVEVEVYLGKSNNTYWNTLRNLLK